MIVLGFYAARFIGGGCLDDLAPGTQMCVGVGEHRRRGIQAHGDPGEVQRSLDLYSQQAF